MFNLLPVLAPPGLIAPGGLAPEVRLRDYPAMAIMSAALYAVACGFRGPGGIVRRWEGVLLLAAFGAYQVLLYLSTVR